jgi:hypothetical protein
MTNAEIIQAIRNEIERLYNGEAPKHDQQCDFSDGYFTALSRIDEFLDTLESEKPSDGLEEEYKDYVESDPVYSKLVNRNAGLSIARHFAEWQYQKDRGKFAEIKAKTWCEGFDACKEQMMKEAVEGTVYGNGEYTWVAGDIPSQFKYGDKVKIIVIHETDI